MARLGSTGQGAAPTTHTVGTDDEGLDILLLLRTLWHGKWFIAGCTTLALLLGGYYAFFVATPRYAATASLAINMRRPLVQEVDSVVTGIMPEFSAMYTELEVITSRRVIEAAVRKLDLTTDPEFNPTLRPAPALSPEGLKRGLRNLIGADLPSAPENLHTDAEAVFNSTAAALRSAVSADARRYTYIFNITAVSEDPLKAARIANTLSQTYIADQIAVKFEAVEQAVNWLSDRVAALETELKQKEDAIKALRGDTDLINAETLEALNRQAKEQRDRLESTRQSAQAARTDLETLENTRASGDRAALAAALNDPTLNRQLRDIADGTSNAGSLFNSRADLLMTRARTNADRLDAQVGALEQAVDRLQQQIREQTADLAQLVQMQRDAEATGVLYETFLTRLKETTVQRGLQQADVRVISEAGRGRYIEPRKSMILGLSLVFGATLAILIILLRQYLFNGFRTGDELSRRTGLPVLGQIPRIPIKHRSELIPYLADRPTSAAVEAVRNLRTSILLSDLDHPPQVIMSTSSIPAEGKTTQAIALAHNLAGMGKRVLLVEGDIRRRTFNKYFSAVGEYGILSVLSGSVPLQRAVIHDDLLRADVLMGEKTSLNAADVFSSETFHEFIRTARQMYDFVIIDTPPVLVVPDARVIAQSVDAVVFSVSWDSTSKSQVAEGLEQFALVNQKVAGLVLSQIDPAGMKRYGYGGKYGAYSSYGNAYYDL
ncbi:polysaccharide biosynthesis tyrosine autokinase [Thalassovita sp.]|uniref:GumC family protein n=1 Tax=Thalassovita sp. TaxID=1979401 RepID=UPI0029DE8C0D|nr:polysaccharide biosynthesis tyrosine autokinase [Thalassovita sp.]